MRLAKIVLNLQQKGVDLKEEFKTENWEKVIQLYWSLSQLGILQESDLSFLSQVELKKLDPHTFQKWKQLVLLATNEGLQIDLDAQLKELTSDGWPEHLMMTEYAKQTSQEVIDKCFEEVK